MNTTTTITARAKAFSCEGVRTHRFLITDTEVRVWDPVAGYFTNVHSLSTSAQRRIRKLAED